MSILSDPANGDQMNTTSKCLPPALLTPTIPEYFISKQQFFTEIALKSLQISVTTIVLELIQNINLIFIGHLNETKYLAAVGLSDMLTYFLGDLFVLGLNEGFTSLASRAYGAKHYRLVGDYLNKSLLLILISFSFIALMTFQGERILLILWQPPEVASLAQEYMLCFLSANFFIYVYDLFRAYLNSIEVFHIHSTISLITTIMHPFICWAFISIGFKGIAYATCITHGINVIWILTYIFVYNPCPESLFLSFQSMSKGIWKYTKYVVPIALPIFFDACFYGVKTMIVGSFHNHAMLAAHILITNIFEIVFCVFLGINVSLNNLTANAVGERNSEKCRLLLQFGYLAGFALSLLFIVNLLCFDEYIFRLFTHIDEVLLEMKEISLIIASFVAFDYVQSTISGVIKGIGLGHKIFIGTVIGYWCIGLPSTLLLGIVLGWQLKGIWLGYGIASAFLFFFNTWIILALKIEELIEEMLKELEEEKTLMEKEEEEFYLELGGDSFNIQSPHSQY